MRFGLSLVGPAGLTKRWNGTVEAAAEEFTLRTYEANPTIAFKLHESVSVAAGLRVIYSDGVVKSSSSATLAVPIGRGSGGRFNRLCLQSGTIDSTDGQSLSGRHLPVKGLAHHKG